MDVTYSPDAGSGGKWQFDWRKVKQSRAEMIEARAGMAWEEWLQAVRFTGNSKARKVLLWHLLSLEHPTYRFEDVPDFAMGELEITYGLAELRDLREMVAKAPGVPADQRDKILTGLDAQIEAELRNPIPGEVVEEGKASPNCASDTPSPSPNDSGSALGSSGSG